MDALALWRRARGQGTGGSDERPSAAGGAIEATLCRLDATDRGVGYLQKVQRGGYYSRFLFRLDYAFGRRDWRSVFMGTRSRLLISDALDALVERRQRLLASLGRQLQGSPAAVEVEMLGDPVAQDEKDLLALARPSMMSKFIVPGAIALITLGVATRLAGRIDWSKARLFALDLVEASQHLLHDWIVSPLVDIWQTIRYRSNSLALVSATALRADVDSLERMVVNFARKHYPQVPEAKVVSQVRSGDVTLMLRRYETELQAPLKNVILGDIISMLLIQVQKSKVDLEGAMAAMDRLLKANELNFELLAVIPLMALLCYGFSLGRGWLLRVLKKSEEHTMDGMRDAMRHIEYLFNNQEDREAAALLGELFVTIKRLLTLWQAMPSKWRCKYDEHFYQDMTELLSMRAASAKLPTVTRMYHYYPFLQGSM